MTRKRKQSNMVRNILILALVIVLVIVVAASYKSEQVPPKDEASEYFAISGADYFPSTEIQVLGFNITAVKGDAHNVHVQCINAEWELVNPSKGGTILQGESVAFEIQLTYAFPLSGIPTGETFPFEISISSDEAVGEITIQLTKR